jgi:hypothetical protein
MTPTRQDAENVTTKDNITYFKKPKMKKFIQLTLTLVSILNIVAQDIPIGTWRSHFSGYKAVSGTVAGDLIYVACEMGMYSYNTKTEAFRTFSKIDGMKGNEINKIAYDSINRTIIIAYSNGQIDLLKDNKFTNISSFYNYSFTGSKITNDIFVKNGVAFLATDAGLLLLDISKKEIKETYSNIGPLASQILAKSVILDNDSIYLATTIGILTGKYSPTVNLQNYNKWTLFEKTQNSKSIVKSSNRILALTNTKIFVKKGTSFEPLIDADPNSKFIFSTENNGFTIANDNRLLIYNFDGTFVNDLYVPRITNILSKQGIQYLISNESGLVVNETNKPLSYKIPPGPIKNTMGRIRNFNGKMYIAPGSFTSDNIVEFNSNGYFYAFDNFKWENYVSNTNGLPPFKSVYDLFAQDDTLYAATSNGVLKIRENDTSSILYDKTNSTIKPYSSDLYMLSGIDGDSKKNIFCSQFLRATGDYSFIKLNKTENGNFKLFYQDSKNGRMTRKIMIDQSDNIWLTPSIGIFDGSWAYSRGITVYNDKYPEKFKVLTNESGNGKLTSNIVLWACKTLTGEVWLGTDNGVNIIDDPKAIFTNSKIPDSRVPVYDSRALLRNKAVQVITVDGANRKWMSTTGDGVWLFSANGDSLIHQFNTDNSPLPSNNIYDIGINPANGEVFFATEKGLVSFRSDATVANGIDDVMLYPVKAFPNPVTPDFEGTIGFSGFGQDAIVKITDISGKLVYETKANGGTATWNAKDQNGKRVASGMYLVFSATADGTTGIVTKIAVIN